MSSSSSSSSSNTTILTAAAANHHQKEEIQTTTTTTDTDHHHPSSVSNPTTTTTDESVVQLQRHILICVDEVFPQGGTDALEWAFRNVIQQGDQVTVLSVVKASSHHSLLENRVLDPLGEEDMALTAIQGLVHKASQTYNKRVSFHCKVMVGDPRSLIVQVGKDIQATMIVVGSRSRSSLANMFLGSVSEYVVRNASQPVLVVRT